MERFGMGISPLDVIELEKQDSLIRRVVAAERDAEYATERANTWIAESARLRESVTGLSRNNERRLSQRNWALLVAVVGWGFAAWLAVRG